MNLFLTVMNLGGMPARGLREVAADLRDLQNGVAASEGAELGPATTDLPRVTLGSWIAASSTSLTNAEGGFLRGRILASHPASVVRDLALGKWPSVLIEAREVSAAESSARGGAVRFAEAAAETVRARLILPGKSVGIRFSL